MHTSDDEADAMTSPSIRVDTDVSADDLVSLYDSVGWTTYTKEPQELALAVRQSLRVVTAWDGEILVGLARVVGDGVTVIYLQDILIAPEHQRRGIGRSLMHEVFAPFGHVRQHVLLTDDEPRQRAFYESLGFTEAHDVRPGELRSFVRFAD